MTIRIFTALVAPLVAEALRRSKKPGRANNALRLPSFRNVLEVKSAIPGRIRLASPLLKGNAAICAQAQEQIARIKAIKTVRINPVTGSMLLIYAPNEVEPQLLEAAVAKLLGLEDMIKRTEGSIVGREIKNMGDAFNHALLDKTGGLLDAKTLIALVLIGVGLYSVITKPTYLPSGYNMLWWGGNAAFGGSSL